MVSKERFDELSKTYPAPEGTDPNKLCVEGTMAHDKFKEMEKPKMKDFQAEYILKSIMEENDKSQITCSKKEYNQIKEMYPQLIAENEENVKEIPNEDKIILDMTDYFNAIEEEKYDVEKEIQKLQDEHDIMFTDPDEYYPIKTAGFLPLVLNDLLNFIDEKHEKGYYIRSIQDPDNKEASYPLRITYKYNEEESIEPGEEAKGKVNIELPGNGVLISEFADKLAPVFKNKNLLFYRKDISTIVEIKDSEFREVKPIRFVTLIERYFTPWIKIWTKSGGSFEVDRSIPQTTSGAVLASPNFEDGILKIERIFPVQIPIMYKNQLTFPKQGYDKRFNSWTIPNSPEIKKDMLLEEAKGILYKIYNEFCFQSNQDYVNAISGLLTPNLRGLFSKFNVRTPFKGYLGNRERVGKDYLAGITGIVYEGQYTEETPISTGEYRASGTNDELRKKITAAFIQGRRGLHFANNKGKLNSAVLEGALTNPFFSDRILGTNKMGVFSNELDYSFSGNIGITLTPDLTNRTIFVNLFLDLEDANARKFDNPKLHQWVLENRGLILSALYSLINNWIEKGRPKGKIPFASYPEWAEICGGIMEAANLGSPCIKDDNISQGIALDPDSEEMKLLFESMYESYPDEWVDKKTIKFLIMNSDDIMPFIKWDEQSDRVRFGQRLHKNINRLYSDIRLIVEDRKIRPSRWKYKFTKEKSTYNKEEIFKDQNETTIVSREIGSVGSLLPSLANVHYSNINRVGKPLPTLPTLPHQQQLLEINSNYNELSKEEQEEAVEILKMNKKEVNKDE
jgi:hypothetical protein